MKIKTILVSCLVLLLAGIGFAQAQGMGQPNFRKIVIFGESTSDIGNTWILTGREIGETSGWDPSDPSTLPTEPVPPLYDNGRWSNGDMWVEVLSDLLGVGGRMTPSLDGGLNYAFTDARVGNGTNIRFSIWTGDPLPEPDVPGIGEQILMHADAKGKINRNDLVVLWVGANDILHAAGPGDLFFAVLKIRRHILELVDLGAKHILVPNQIDPSGAPFFAALSQDERDTLREATEGFNNSLRIMLGLLQTRFGEDVTLYPMDFFSLASDLISSGCGPTDANTPASWVYLESYPGDPLEIDDSVFDDFVYWDTVHPTKAIHSLLAEAAASYIRTGEYDIPCL